MKDHKSALAMMLVALVPMLAQADVPSAINFQGRLTDAAGNSLTGAQSVVFSVWDSATAGTQLWSETQTVSVSSGIYNAALGSLTSISTAVFADPNSWLQIQVGADAPMSPRLKVQSTPYAFNAQMALQLLSILPFSDLLNITPLNATINTSGYTVPAGKNLIVATIYKGSGGGGCDKVDWPNPNPGVFNCNIRVTGAHTATTVLSRRSKTNPFIAGPGDVLSSTSANISFGLRGVLVPQVVPVVLQDIGIGGTYTVPAGKSLYFGVFGHSPFCTGTVNFNGFLQPLFGMAQGGVLQAGQTFTNSTDCDTTLNGYLK